MPPKNNNIKKVVTVDNSDDENNSSDDEIIHQKTKSTKKTVIDLDDSDENTKQTKSKSKSTKKTVIDQDVKQSKKVKNTDIIEDETEELENENESDDDTIQDDESDEDITDSKSKRKEKKQKESFGELTKRIDIYRNEIKIIDKEINDLEKNIKSKEKVRTDNERQLNNALKLLSKTHSDEVTKAIKERPKRKGNVNGGFNKEQPVPNILCSFLGLPVGTNMARPKVMSALNNKFNELKLKNGQITVLDKETAKELGLGKAGDGKVIKFTEFQTFLATFYPNKENELVV